LTETIDQNAIVLVNLPAGQTARRSALAAALALVVSAAIIAPFASVQLPRFEAFVPISQTIIFVNDLITWILLISQFVIVGWLAILVLAIGYLFTALLDITQLLTFPGTFTPTGLLGAGLQTTGWLYEFWHAGFPIAVIFYVALKDREQASSVSHGSTRAAIATSVAATIALVLGLTWISTAGEEYLPKLFLDGTRQTPVAAFASGFVLLLSVVALLMLWFRRRSALDLWLMVAMCAWSLDIVVQTLAASRFTLGFYASRVYAVTTATCVLIALLSETMTLYVRLAVAVFESDLGHMNRVSMMGELAASLSHEITQPIASARNNARAAQNFLEQQPPDLGEVREALGCIVGDADRAGDIIERVRDHIKKAPPRKIRFDLNAAINEVIVLARSAIIKDGISVETRLADGLFPIQGDRIQLQQVVLNLILNAVEAMGSVEAGARELSISTEQHRRGALVAVRDSGPGIGSDHFERVFDAFYTTKPGGTGMGLSICRSIIESHGGRLWAEANEPRGAVFQFTLPAS
jgi:signal transduction histidine kinase